LSLLLFLFVACGEEEDTSVCEAETFQCDGELLLSCDEGEWTELADCEIMGVPCDADAGACQ
jgi:hypothetical protein